MLSLISEESVMLSSFGFHQQLHNLTDSWCHCLVISGVQPDLRQTKGFGGISAEI